MSKTVNLVDIVLKIVVATHFLTSTPEANKNSERHFKLKKIFIYSLLNISDQLNLRALMGQVTNS